MNGAIPGVMSGLRPPAATCSRYPGAQPFGDNDLSRRTFFGRERESTDLTNRILASRLTVVYGRSGLGKSSLLNAGVAQRLRVQRHVPLLLRLNDTDREFGDLVAERVRECAELQGYEVIEGDRRSLWQFFKTAEIWDGDLLLTPVLIFDQFEEVFTLQSSQWREGFLPELGALIRGEPPPPEPGTEAETVTSETPPPLRVVLSLREDFLGLLEDAADHIPRILDNRFRLTPLTLDASREALTAPAAIQDPSFPCPSFRFSEEAIDLILGFLTRIAAPLNAGGGYPLQVTAGRPVVDPFQLQLLCQRMERLVLERRSSNGFSGSSDDLLRIEPADFAGEQGLSGVIDRFYGEALRDCVRRFGRHKGLIEKWKLRRRINRLCTELLISPEGKRLSVEQNEIRRRLGLRQELLDHLVNLRLLRMDQRAGSLYYELSHDTLVRAVFNMQIGWLTNLSGLSSFLSFLFFSAVTLLGILFFCLTLYYIYSVYSKGPPDGDTISVVLEASIALFVSLICISWCFSNSRKAWMKLHRNPYQRANIAIAIGGFLIIIGILFFFRGLFMAFAISTSFDPNPQGYNLYNIWLVYFAVGLPSIVWGYLNFRRGWIQRRRSGLPGQRSFPRQLYL